MAERGNSLSRNPNVCASCSSLADGMEDPSLPTPHETASDKPVQPPASPPVIPATAEIVVLEWGPQDEESKHRPAPVSQAS